MKKPLSAVVYVSAVMVALGVFLPFITLPIYGDVTYQRLSSIDAYLVMGFALSAPVVVWLGWIRLSLLSLVGVWGTLLFPLLKRIGNSSGSSDTGAVGEWIKQASAPVRDALLELAIDNIDVLSWGGYVFVGGLVLLTVSSLVLSAMYKK